MKRLLTKVRAFFSRWFKWTAPDRCTFCWECGYAQEPETVCTHCAWGNAPDPEWERLRDIGLFC